MAISYMLLTSSDQEWQFYIAADMSTGQEWDISHWYWHLVVTEWQSSDLLLIKDIYWIKNDNFTLLLISTGQEWQFHIATDI